MGKWFITAGLLLVLAGLMIMLFQRLGIHLGRLPGDIVYKKGNSVFYFPVTTSILISVLLSLVLWLFKK